MRPKEHLNFGRFLNVKRAHTAHNKTTPTLYPVVGLNSDATGDHNDSLHNNGVNMRAKAAL